ncbi:MAG: methyltransferase domain-containing protein [Actinomycetia bacterium]|nr:methyltransferase domain-containing protein [Actinomycetes bacterium]
MSEPTIDPDILAYYRDEWDEDARIRSGLHEIELIRTKEILRRHLPGGPLRIIDIGGGSGVHAEWLLEDGHEVHLVDPLLFHVEQASAHLGDIDRFTSEVGDARSLVFEDATFDAALLLGPLYHLTERTDRVCAWSEARRVTKQGGLVFAVGISKFAPIPVGLADGVIFDELFMKLVEGTLSDGQHRNPPGREYFTTAFFHHPDELRREAEDSGLTVLAIVGIEGFAGILPQLEEHWDDPDKRDVIVEMARAIESEPTLLGVGPHIMVVARNAG